MYRLHLSKTSAAALPLRSSGVSLSIALGTPVNDFKVNICILEDFSTWLLEVKEIVDNRVTYLSGARTCCHVLLDA